jgi:flavoprotein
MLKQKQDKAAPVCGSHYAVEKYDALICSPNGKAFMALAAV